jgi:hypothetical protein
MFLILLAGLMAVPRIAPGRDILGASWYQKLRHVVLPIVKPIILIALIIRGMEAFKIFDAAWLLTQGGPGEVSSTISVNVSRGVPELAVELRRGACDHRDDLRQRGRLPGDQAASSSVRGRHESAGDDRQGAADQRRARRVPLPGLLDRDDNLKPAEVDTDERRDLLVPDNPTLDNFRRIFGGTRVARPAFSSRPRSTRRTRSSTASSPRSSGRSWR